MPSPSHLSLLSVSKPPTLSAPDSDLSLSGLAQFLHQRQLQQEALIEAELPAAETVKLESDTEKELDNKLVGIIEPVKNSGTIM